MHPEGSEPFFEKMMKMTKNDEKAIKVGLFITIGLILNLILASALTIEDIKINDQLNQDGSMREVMNLSLSDNRKQPFIINLPAGAENIVANNISFGTNNSINISLNCDLCKVAISYDLKGVANRKDEQHVEFTRTVNLPLRPRLMQYSVSIPAGYGIDTAQNANNPAIVPALSKITTDGKHIIVVWEEMTPVLPRIYFVRYQLNPENFMFISDFIRVFQSWPVWVILMIIFSLGVGTGVFIMKLSIKKMLAMMHLTKRKAERIEKIEVHNIPATLLSPDEKRIILLLEDNEKSMGQKDIVVKLNWSKSKVSAILSNLEYKQIISREKYGRNYKVKLIKEISSSGKNLS